MSIWKLVKIKSLTIEILQLNKSLQINKNSMNSDRGLNNKSIHY